MGNLSVVNMYCSWVCCHSLCESILPGHSWIKLGFLVSLTVSGYIVFLPPLFLHFFYWIVPSFTFQMLSSLRVPPTLPETPTPCPLILLLWGLPQHTHSCLPALKFPYTGASSLHRTKSLGIHPICSHQTQTLLWMPSSACWQEHDMAVSWEALPEPDKYRGGCSQPTIGLSTGSPMEELEKGLKELKGFVTP